MIALLIRPLLRLLGFFIPGGTRHSRPVEGNAETMGPGEKIWWAHKFFVRPVEHAQRGTDIEERFAGAPLRFDLPSEFEADTSATLTSAGDLLSSEHIRPDSTRHLWDDIAEWAFASDFAIANLETPVAPSRAAAAPPRSILHAPPLNTSLDMLRRFTGPGDGPGFDFFTTANNHCLDQGFAGLAETLDVLDAEGCGHVGTSRSVEEQDDIPVVRIGDISVALLSYTFSTNGRTIPERKEFSVNHVRLNLPDPDLSLISRHIAIAREQKGADLVVVCPHWSLEFESYPVQRLVDTAHRIAELGVDAILGNHPHTVQPMERHRFTDPLTGFEKDALIIYAHGDTVSYLPAVPNSMLGMVVRIGLVAGTQAGRRVARIASVEHRLITRRARFEGRECVDFRVLDLDAELGRLAVPGQDVGD